MVNTGSHGANTPFVKELWTMYSFNSVQICCKQWAKGLCVRRYWPLYGVNVCVPRQAVCVSDRVLGRRLRLRLRQVVLGQVWTSWRLSCHIGQRQEVEFGSKHHNELGEEPKKHWALLADKLPFLFHIHILPSSLINTTSSSHFGPFFHCTKYWNLWHQKASC